MTKLPDNFKPEYLIIFKAIREGIRENKSQRTISAEFGKGKNYVNDFLKRNGFSWKVLKAEVKLEIADLIMPENLTMPDKRKKVQLSPNGLPTNRYKPPKKSTKNKSEIPTPKITNVEINTEEYFFDGDELADQINEKNKSDDIIDNSNEEIIQNATDINEDLYSALLLTYLKRVHNEDSLKSTDLAELRNYLDKTEKLQSQNSDLYVDKINFDTMQLDSESTVNKAKDFMLSDEFTKTVVKKHQIEVEHKT